MYFLLQFSAWLHKKSTDFFFMFWWNLEKNKINTFSVYPISSSTQLRFNLIKKACRSINIRYQYSCKLKHSLAHYDYSSALIKLTPRRPQIRIWAQYHAHSYICKLMRTIRLDCISFQALETLHVRLSNLFLKNLLDDFKISKNISFSTYCVWAKS